MCNGFSMVSSKINLDKNLEDKGDGVTASFDVSAREGKEACIKSFKTLCK